MSYFEGRIEGAKIREYCGVCVGVVKPVEGEPPYVDREPPYEEL